MHIKNLFKKSRDSKQFLHNLTKTSQMTIMDGVFTEHPELEIPITRKEPFEARKDFELYYPKNELWRLIVDGKQYAKTPSKYFFPLKNDDIIQELDKKTSATFSNVPWQSWATYFQDTNIGWRKYESKEKGSIKASLMALNYALRHSQENRDDNNFVQQIHKLVISDVNFSPPPVINLNPGKYKFGAYVRFALISKNRLTTSGLRNLLHEISNNKIEGSFIYAPDALEKVFNSLPELLPIKSILLTFGEQITYQSLNRIKINYANLYETFINELAKSILKSTSSWSTFYYASYTTYMKKVGDLVSSLKVNVPQNGLLEVYNTDSKVHQFIAKLHRSLPVTLKERLESEINLKLFQEKSDKVDCIESSILHELLSQISNPSFYESYDNLKKIFDSLASLDELISEAASNLVIYMASCLAQNKVAALVDKTWEDYHARISKAQSDDEILKIIGETIQSFERIHPFFDGNGRTFANITLTVLLLENGFPPATFYDPNIFDAYGDFVNGIKRGIANTLEIYEATKAGKEPDLFGVKTSDVENSIKTEIADIDNRINKQLREKDPSYFRISVRNRRHKRQLLMSEILKDIDKENIPDGLHLWMTNAFRSP